MTELTEKQKADDDGVKELERIVAELSRYWQRQAGGVNEHGSK